MADSRAADVAETQRLLAAAGQGPVKLPVLSAAELWALCGDRQVAADESESRWWAAMPGPQRDKLVAAMTDLLAHRGLLRPAGPATAGLMERQTGQ